MLWLICINQLSGAVFFFRKIKGFMERSIILSLIKKLQKGSGLLIYLNRNHNLKFDLKEYTLSSEYFTGELSVLNILEALFILGAILKLFEILLVLWSSSDRSVSVLNVKPKLCEKLSSRDLFYFKIGVYIFGPFAWLQALGQIIFGYLILGLLELISFIRIDVIFESFDYILNSIFKLCGFNTKETFSLPNKLDE